VDGETDLLQRLWDELVARPSGPMAFRFILQPVMGAIFAIRDGMKDARVGRSPYFWTVLHDPVQRGPRLREGFAAMSRVIGLGVIMEAIYQWRVLGGFRPLEMAIVVLLLCFVPYLLIRGPVARIAGRWGNSRGAGGHG
jgi:hypothetical protein